MKIIIIKPLENGIYKDDTSMFIEELSKKHDVVPLLFKDNILYIKEEKDLLSPDIIWAPYEPLIGPALVLKDNYGGRVVGHYEQVPPTRIKIDDIDEEYFNNPERKPTHMEKSYKSWGMDFLNADIKTTTDLYTKLRVEKLIGYPLGKTYIKPFPLDNNMFEPYRGNFEEKYQICSFTRLVNTKKIKHLIRALSIVDNPPKLIIGGVGPQKNELQQYAKELKVDVEFIGIVSDIIKAKTIQESMFCVYLWVWIPISEASFFKKPSITYYQPDTYKRFGDLPIYVPCNNINELRKNIEYLCKNKEERIKIGEEAYNKLSKGECKSYFVEEATKKLMEIFNDDGEVI